MKKITTVTILSILIFFSISFITILCQINPLHYYKDNEKYKLYIGFPFKYYNQFFVDESPIPNSGWNLKNLFFDCLITYIAVIGIYFTFKKFKK